MSEKVLDYLIEKLLSKIDTKALIATVLTAAYGQIPEKVKAYRDDIAKIHINTGLFLEMSEDGKFTREEVATLMSANKSWKIADPTPNDAKKLIKKFVPYILKKLRS